MSRRMDAAFAALVRDVRRAGELETMLVRGDAVRSCGAATVVGKAARRNTAKTAAGDASTARPKDDPVDAAAESVKRVVAAVQEARKKQRVEAAPSCDDAVLCRMARFTDAFALQSYARFLQFVPRIVNVARGRVRTGTACPRTHTAWPCEAAPVV